MGVMKKIIYVDCPLCMNTKEVIYRPARLIGATYPSDDTWKGDEHFVPCPLCTKEAENETEGKRSEDTCD